MNHFLSRITKVILYVTVPFVIFTTIDFLTEITGGRLGDYLQEYYGITKKTLFIVLLVFLLISLSYQIYEKWNEENAKTLASNSENLALNVENLFELIEQTYIKKYGKKVELKIEFEQDEDVISDENDGIERNKSCDGIKVFPSEKVYARLNIKDEDWRKEFTVRYPIMDGLKSESISLKINSILNYEKVFDISLIDSIESETWLTDLDYTIKLLKKPFLCIEFLMEGTGAYPTITTQNLLINYETGERVLAKDIFNKESLKRLTSIINEFIQIDLTKSMIMENYLDEIPLKLVDNETVDSDNILWNDRIYLDEFTIKDLDNFSIDETGITFEFDFHFPRLLKFIEPEGKYYFEFSSLKQFIKKNSEIEKFIKENTFQF